MATSLYNIKSRFYKLSTNNLICILKENTFSWTMRAKYRAGSNIYLPRGKRRPRAIGTILKELLAELVSWIWGFCCFCWPRREISFFTLSRDAQHRVQLIESTLEAPVDACVFFMQASFKRFVIEEKFKWYTVSISIVTFVTKVKFWSGVNVTKVPLLLSHVTKV